MNFEIQLTKNNAIVTKGRFRDLEKVGALFRPP